MTSCNTLRTGNGWILPDGKCIEILGGLKDLKFLCDRDATIKSMFALISPNATRDMASILEYIYRTNHVRVGKYRGTILFEHGADRRVSVDEMYSTVPNILYKGNPVICKSALYTPGSSYRRLFFSDIYK